MCIMGSMALASVALRIFIMDHYAFLRALFELKTCPAVGSGPWGRLLPPSSWAAEAASPGGEEAAGGGPGSEVALVGGAPGGGGGGVSCPVGHGLGAPFPPRATGTEAAAPPPSWEGR